MLLTHTAVNENEDKAANGFELRRHVISRCLFDSKDDYTAQVVETTVTVNNSPIQNYTAHVMLRSIFTRYRSNVGSYHQ